MAVVEYHRQWRARGATFKDLPLTDFRKSSSSDSLRHNSTGLPKVGRDIQFIYPRQLCRILSASSSPGLSPESRQALLSTVGRDISPLCLLCTPSAHALLEHSTSLHLAFTPVLDLGDPCSIYSTSALSTAFIHLSFESFS